MEADKGPAKFVFINIVYNVGNFIQTAVVKTSGETLEQGWEAGKTRQSGQQAGVLKQPGVAYLRSSRSEQKRPGEQF